VAEEQLLNCTATGGTFTLSFRSGVDTGSGTRVARTTAPLPHNASVAAVAAALEALDTVGSVRVTYSSDATAESFCVGGGGAGPAPDSHDGNVVRVRFLDAIGDLPALVPGTADLVNAPYADDDPARGVIHVATGGEVRVPREDVPRAWRLSLRLLSYPFASFRIPSPPLLSLRLLSDLFVIRNSHLNR
jgi:hypothetical protein